MSNLNVIVISVPNSNRLNPLKAQLYLSNKFRVYIQAAEMFDKHASEFSPNYSKQKQIYGRHLSEGEIGCTISHWTIYKNFRFSDAPCVILEDDARIPNITNFESLIEKFIRHNSSKNAVLSLLPWRQEMAHDKFRPKINRLVGRTPLTVGYVITPRAMQELYLVNKDYAYLPDWPPSSTVFYTSVTGVISHGDDETFSLIDVRGRFEVARNSLLYRLRLRCNLRPLQHFENFTEYLRALFLPGITWRLDVIRMKLFYFL